MLLGEIFQSVEAWRKLSAISMKPKLAYRILKYTKLVSAEHAIAEQQRNALIREITSTEEGQDARIEPNSPEFTEFSLKLQKILVTESDLEQLDLDFEEVVNAVDDKNESLTVSDLAMLEPFFKLPELDPMEDDPEAEQIERKEELRGTQTPDESGLPTGRPG